MNHEASPDERDDVRCVCLNLQCWHKINTVVIPDLLELIHERLST